MDRSTYLKRFSWMARWFLPLEQAEEAVADYGEILALRGEESDGTLTEDLGEPGHAVRLLVEPRSYGMWLGIFGLMSLSILLPEILLLWGGFRGYPFVPMAGLHLLGIGTALVWFRTRGTEKKPGLNQAKGLLPALAGLVVMLVVAGAVMWMLATVSWDGLPARMYGLTAQWTLRIAGTVSAAAGVFGLVKARLSDRRWRALYILGLTAVVECVLVAAILTSMSLDTAASDWWVGYALRMGVVCAVGLMSTGVALC